jgi:hypothetical protein
VRPFLISAGLALLLGSSAMAAEVKGLYRIETAVRSRDEAARTADLRAALSQVLKRLVRSNDLASRPVRDILAKPADYILEFDYATRGEGEWTVPVLRVDFDPARLNAALRQRGVEVWGAERPEVLVYLALKNAQGPPAPAAERMPDADRILDELAATTGLPIALPLWDLADQQALSLADIESGNAERIGLAAQRYGTDTVLTGSLVQSAGNAWEADWRLYQGSTPERWRGQAADFRELLATGMDGAYSRLAGRLIPKSAATATVELRIGCIESLDDANRVASYLERLAPVTRLEWLSVGTGDAAFKVSARGGREVLRQTLNLSALLRPAAGRDAGAGPLSYQMADCAAPPIGSGQ